MSCAGDGRALHYHEMALNTLASGRKRWAVLPPRHALFSTQFGPLVFAELDVDSFFRNNRTDAPDASNAPGALGLQGSASTAPLQCIQEAGDMILVPAFWTHATLALDRSFAFAAFMDFEPVRPSVS